MLFLEGWVGADEVRVAFFYVIQHKIYEKRSYTWHNYKIEGEWLMCTHHIFHYSEPHQQALSHAHDWSVDFYSYFCSVLPYIDFFDFISY